MAPMKTRHLISMEDLSRSEIQKILDLAAKIKRTPRAFQNALRGKMFGLIFEKPSTRTWVSFEVGIQSLGGGAIYLGPEDIQLGVREAVQDVARVLDRYLDGVILRTFSHQTITTFERYFHKPVINGLSDFEHPCQALGDFLTIREKFKGKKKPLLAYVGDANNVFNSLMLLSAKSGAAFRYATPRDFPPNRGVVKKAKELAQKSGAAIEGSHDPKEAVRGADFVYTDVWISMGEEGQREGKMKSFRGFQVNRGLLHLASRDAKVMHCLPAHRGEEITDDVLEGKSSVVFDQAENRLHVQKAVLVHLCA
jgi:ornithine carbamoyltransferase